MPRRHKRKKKRFPRFFEEAVGPIAPIEVPGELTPHEEETVGADTRVEDVPAPAGFLDWALRPDEDDSGWVTEIDVPFPDDLGEGAGGDEGPAPSGMFSEDESPGVDAIASYR